MANLQSQLNAVRKKGESSREFEARKTGGTLNYNTGKITKPVSKPVSKPAQTYASRIQGVQQDVKAVTQPSNPLGLQQNALQKMLTPQAPQQPQTPQKSQQQSLTEKVASGVNKVKSFLGESASFLMQHPKEVVKEIPQATKTVAGAIGKGVKELAVGTARLPITQSIKAIETLGEAGGKTSGTYTPQTKVEKFLVGNEPITSYTQDQKAIEKFGKEQGLSKTQAIALGLAGGVAEVGLDFALGGEGKATEQILKATTAKEAKSILQKAGQKATPEIIDRIINATKKSDAELLVKELSGKVKPASEIKSAVIEGKNGKVYEGASHAEAISKAPKAEQADLLKNKEADGLFKTKDGKLITRAEANKTYGITHSEEVPHLKAAQDAKPTPKVATQIQKESGLIEKARTYSNGEDFYQKSGQQTISELRDKGIRGQEQVTKWFNENVTPKEKVLDSLNPTGGLYVDYAPQERMKMPLGKNMTTLDKTAGKKADEMVTIYRGAPKNQTGINPGDFITDNPELAKTYGENVISKKVKYSDILDDTTDSLGNEYIYRPKSPSPIQIPKESGLIAEAKKYKTEEEFIKAQRKLLHGTNKEFDKFDLSRSGDIQPSDWGEGAYFTDNIDNAKNFAKVSGGDVVMERYAPNIKYADGSKLLKDSDFMSALDDEMGFTTPGEYLSEKGYGGVKFKNPQGFTEYVVFNPDEIYTKSQLSEIYKQAHEVPKVEPKVEPKPKVAKVESFDADKVNRQISYVKQGQAKATQAKKGLLQIAKEEADRAKLIQSDVQKTFENATIAKPKAGKSFISAVKDIFDPVHGVKEGKQIKEAFREHAAIFRHDVATATRQSEERAKFWDKIKPEDQLNFIHSIETGKPLKGQEQMFNDYKQAFEKDYKIMEKINPDAPYRKDYFTHNGLWADPKQAEEFYNKWAKEQFGGGKKFFKARSFPTVYDGLKAGLELKEANPEKLFLNNHTNVLKAKMADDFTKEMVSNGMPDGATQAIIDRYMDRGLKNNAIYRTIAEANSGLNMFQLGLSAFHFTTTSVNSIVSKAALAAKELTQGRFVSAGKHVLETPFSIITDYIRGSKEFKDNPEFVKVILPFLKDNENIGKNIPMILKGGGTIEKGGGYQMGEWNKMKESFRKGNIVSGSLKIPFAVMEKVASPLMDNFVPRLKVGSYIATANSELERLGKNATNEVQRNATSKIWDSMDNRFGQLVQDNLMWNQTFKDVLNVDTRSLGWNFGTIRELGGGVLDAFKPETYKALARGEGISDRTAYAITLPLVTAGIATVIMKMHGQKPQSALDYFYPRTGEKTKQGYAERISIPGYMKDMFSYKENPAQTLINKQSAIANVGAKLLELSQTGGIKDFYGNWIVDPYASQTEKSKQFATFAVSQFLPFSVSGAKQRVDQSLTAKTESFLGFQPAGATITKGKEVTDLAQMWRDLAPTKPKTPEEAKAFEDKLAAMEPKQGKTPEQAKKELDFLRSLRSQKPDSEERKNSIQEYMNTLTPEERKSMNYKLSVLGGISTKGVTLSEDVLNGRPMLQKYNELMDAGKKSEANKYEGSLTDDEYKQYKAAEKSANLQKSNQFKADNGKRLEDLAKKVKALGNNRAEINKIENALSDEEFNLYDKYLQKQ